MLATCLTGAAFGLLCSLRIEQDNDVKRYYFFPVRAVLGVWFGVGVGAFVGKVATGRINW